MSDHKKDTPKFVASGVYKPTMSEAEAIKKHGFTAHVTSFDPKTGKSKSYETHVPPEALQSGDEQIARIVYEADPLYCGVTNRIMDFDSIEAQKYGGRNRAFKIARALLSSVFTPAAVRDGVVYHIKDMAIAHDMTHGDTTDVAYWRDEFQRHYQAALTAFASEPTPTHGGK